MLVQAETTRLSSKGQVVLPSSFRRAHNWRAGTVFAVEETAEGVLLKPLADAGHTRIEDVAGCLKPRRPPVSVEEMDEAIARETAERHARGRY
jgi:AbrB family looped-hinge helix DNA binding protein